MTSVLIVFGAAPLTAALLLALLRRQDRRKARAIELAAEQEADLKRRLQEAKAALAAQMPASPLAPPAAEKWDALCLELIADPRFLTNVHQALTESPRWADTT